MNKQHPGIVFNLVVSLYSSMRHADTLSRASKLTLHLAFQDLPLVSCSINPQVNARRTARVLGRTADQRNSALAIKQRDSHLSGSELTSNLGFGHKSKITAVHVEGSVNPAESMAAGTPAGTSS